MSIPYSGTFKRSGGISNAIRKQLMGVNLKPVKRVVVKFDPFHENIRETREFLFKIATPKIQETNLDCRIKTEILCNRSEPSVTFMLNNSESIVFKSKNLTCLEMFQLYNKHISSLVPPEQPMSSVPKTKSEKKAARRKF